MLLIGLGFDYFAFKMFLFCCQLHIGLLLLLHILVGHSTFSCQCLFIILPSSRKMVGMIYYFLHDHIWLNSSIFLIWNIGMVPVSFHRYAKGWFPKPVCCKWAKPFASQLTLTHKMYTEHQVAHASSETPDATGSSASASAFTAFQNNCLWLMYTIS